MQSVTLRFNGAITRVIQILILSNSNTEKKVAGSHLKKLYILVTIIHNYMCMCDSLLPRPAAGNGPPDDAS